MSLKFNVLLSALILSSLFSFTYAKEGIVFRRAEAIFKADLLEPLKKSIFKIEYEPSGERLLYMGKDKTQGHIVLGMQGPLLVTIKYDKNGDQFYEYIEKRGLGGRFFKETLKANKQNFHHYRERHYRTNSFQVRIIFERRDSAGEDFKKVGEREEFAFQAMGSDLGDVDSALNELAAPSCRLGMGILKFDDNRLISDMSEIQDKYGIGKGMVKSKHVGMVLEVDESCEDSIDKTIGRGEGKPFESIVQESLTEGMKCLKGLTENNGSVGNKFNSSADIMYVRAGARILGSQLFDDHTSINDGPDVSHPRLSDKRGLGGSELQFICAEKEDFFKRLNDSHYEDGVALGYASVEPDQTRSIQCEGSREVTLNHPFISLNMRKVLDDARRNRLNSDEVRVELKKIIFHEFLHTTGIRHNPVYDPIGACAEYCFGQNSDDLKEKCKGGGTVEPGLTSVINKIGANLRDLSNSGSKEVVLRETMEYLRSTNEFSSRDMLEIQNYDYSKSN